MQVGLFLEAGVMALAAVAWSVCGRGWSIETIEGGGFIVHRPFPTDTLSDFDPFLLLDEGF